MSRARLLLAVWIWLGVAAGSPAEPLRVTATTSLLASLIKDVGGARVEVNVLIPPASCPGHFDLRPGDVAAISRTGVLFAHQFERFVNRVSELGGKRVQIHRIHAEGNWLVPQTYAQAGERVASILSTLDPAGSGEYRRNLGRLRQRTEALDRELKVQMRRAGVSGKPVVASDMLTPLLIWMGMQVVAVYGRAEDLTPLEWRRVVDTARRANVRLVIDNLQSGASTGKEMARELNAQHVTLSNFPGAFPNTASWEQCLRENVRRVILAVKEGSAAEL